MSLIELKTFLEVIEEKGITAAANKLNLTQPAVTKRLENLKITFGIEKLFSRKKGEFTVTENAKLLIPYAQNMVALAENAKSEIKMHTTGNKGKLFIGTGTTWSLSQLPIGLAKTLLEFPELEINLNVDSPDIQLEKLLKNKIDILFARKPSKLSDINYHSLSIDKFLIFSSSSNENAKKISRAKDLTKFKWVMNTTTKKTEDLFFNWFSVRNLPRPFIALKTNSLRMSLRLVENSSLLLFTASHVYTAPESSLLTNIQIKGFDLELDTGVITRKGYRSNFLNSLIKNL